MVTTEGLAGEDGATFHMLPASNCYFSGDSNTRFHSKLFVYVDFGPLANNFLTACGTKQEPSIEEIACTLLSDPRRFYELVDGCEK